MPKEIRKNKKYSIELKEEAVKAYLQGEGSLRTICKNIKLQIRYCYESG